MGDRPAGPDRCCSRAGRSRRPRARRADRCGGPARSRRPSPSRCRRSSATCGSIRCATAWSARSALRARCRRRKFAALGPRHVGRGLGRGRPRRDRRVAGHAPLPPQARSPPGARRLHASWRVGSTPGVDAAARGRRGRGDRRAAPRGARTGRPRRRAAPPPPARDATPALGAARAGGAVRAARVDPRARRVPRAVARRPVRAWRCGRSRTVGPTASTTRPSCVAGPPCWRCCPRASGRHAPCPTRRPNAARSPARSTTSCSRHASSCGCASAGCRSSRRVRRGSSRTALRVAGEWRTRRWSVTSRSAELDAVVRGGGGSRRRRPRPRRHRRRRRRSASPTTVVRSR